MIECKLQFSFFLYISRLNVLFDCCVPEKDTGSLFDLLICVGSQMSAAMEWDNRGELSSSVRELEAPACVRYVCDLVSKLLFQHMESRKHIRPAKYDTQELGSCITARSTNYQYGLI